MSRDEDSEHRCRLNHNLFGLESKSVSKRKKFDENLCFFLSQIRCSQMMNWLDQVLAERDAHPIWRRDDN